MAVAKMDPDNPNTRQFAVVIADIWGRYIQTHTLEEIYELKERVRRNKEIRRQLFGQPRPVRQPVDQAAAGEQGD